MKCENCGAEIKEKAKFCGACGQKVKKTLKKQKENTSTKKKGKIITISVLSSVFFTLILLTVLFFLSPAYSVFSNMNLGKYKKASIEYRADVKDSTIQKELLQFLLDDSVNLIVEDYNNKKLEYDEVISALTVLDEMDFEDADKKKQEIIIEHESNDFFENGKAFYKKGEYESAILEYKKISESWSSYDDVEEMLVHAYNAYVDQVYKSAVIQNADKKYKEAITILNKVHNIVPDNIDVSKLDEIKSLCIEGYKTEVKNEVEILIDGFKYSDAFKIIDSAINFDDNEFFKMLKNSTEEKYISWITTTVDSHLVNEDYISAKRVVENSFNTLPNNSKLKELKEKVEKLTPTYLLDVCKPYESNKYKEFTNGEIITMGGNTYTNAFVFDANYSKPYALFNLEMKYTKISFWIGHIDGTSMKSNTIKIYYDGVLSNEISVGAEELPKKITIDLTGVKQLKFFMEAENWDRGDIGFANIVVE